MFDRLVFTDSQPTSTGRKWHFLLSAFFVSMALAAGLLVSLFSKELSLGTDSFDMVELVAPVERPVPEPEPPALVEPEQRPEITERPAPVEAPPQRRTPARTTRRVNMARLDETPLAAPKDVSSERNTYSARPDDRNFAIGRYDIDHGAISASTGPGRGGSSNGSGTGTSYTTGKSLSGLSSAASTAPPPPPPPRKKAPPVRKALTRSMGVINGKASSLPKPGYSAAARAVGARGKVSVKVLINESGRVVSADAVSGHPLLRNSAEAAARKARFSPTLLSGAPVKVSGVIVYNFVA